MSGQHCRRLQVIFTRTRRSAFARRRRRRWRRKPMGWLWGMAGITATVEWVLYRESIKRTSPPVPRPSWQAYITLGCGWKKGRKKSLSNVYRAPRVSLLFTKYSIHHAANFTMHSMWRRRRRSRRTDKGLKGCRGSETFYFKRFLSDFILAQHD